MINTVYMNLYETSDSKLRVYNLLNIFFRSRYSISCLSESKRSGTLFTAWTAPASRLPPSTVSFVSRSTECTIWWTFTMVSLSTRRSPQRSRRKRRVNPPEVTCSTDIWTILARCRSEWRKEETEGENKKRTKRSKKQTAHQQPTGSFDIRAKN